MRYWLAGLLACLLAGAARADASDGQGGIAACTRFDFTTETVVRDLAALTPEQALRLNGARGLFRVETAGPWRDASVFQRCQCAVDDRRVFAEMFMPTPGAQPLGKMTVKATLVVFSNAPTDEYWYYLRRTEKQP
jgi:hypothetical protein